MTVETGSSPSAAVTSASLKQLRCFLGIAHKAAEEQLAKSLPCRQTASILPNPDKYGAAMQFAKGQELIIQLPSSGSQIIGTWDGSQFCVGSSLHLHSTPNCNSGESDADENNPGLCNNRTGDGDMSAFESRSPSFNLPVNERLEDSIHTIHHLRAQVSKLKESNLQLMKETSKLKRDVMTIQEAAKEEVKSQERKMRHLQAENKELKGRLASMQSVEAVTHVAVASESKVSGVVPSEEPAKDSTRSLFETIGGLVSEPKASHRKSDEGRVLSNLQNMLKSMRSVKASEKVAKPTKRKEAKKVKAVSSKDMMSAYVSMAEKQTVAKIISAKSMAKVRDKYLCVRKQLLTKREEEIEEKDSSEISEVPQPKLSRSQRKKKRLQEESGKLEAESSKPALDFLSNILNTTASKSTTEEVNSGDSTKAMSFLSNIIKSTAPIKATGSLDDTRLEDKSNNVEPEKAMNFLTNIIKSTSSPKPSTIEEQRRFMSAELRRKVKDPRLKWRLDQEAEHGGLVAAPDPLAAIAAGLNLPEAAGFFFKKQSIEPKWKLILLDVHPVPLVYQRNPDLKQQLIQAIWSRRDPRKWALMKKDSEGKGKSCPGEAVEDLKEEKSSLRGDTTPEWEKSPGAFAFAEPAVPAEKVTPRKKPPDADDLFDSAVKGSMELLTDALDDCSMWSMHSTEPPASPNADRHDDSLITNSLLKQSTPNSSGLLFNDLYMSDTEDALGEVSKSSSTDQTGGEVNFQNTLRTSVHNILESLEESDGEDKKVPTNVVEPTPKKMKENSSPKKFTFGEDILAKQPVSEYVSPKKKHARCAMEADDDSLMIDLHAPTTEDAELFSQEEDSCPALDFDIGQEQGVSRKIENILETLEDRDPSGNETLQQLKRVPRSSLRRAKRVPSPKAGAMQRRESRSSRSSERRRDSKDSKDKSRRIVDERRESEKERERKDRDRKRDGVRRYVEHPERRSRDRRSTDERTSRETAHSDRRCSERERRTSTEEDIRRISSDKRSKSPERRNSDRRDRGRAKSPPRRSDVRKIIDERSKRRRNSRETSSSDAKRRRR